jgi:hypothetical protein
LEESVELSNAIQCCGGYEMMPTINEEKMIYTLGEMGVGGNIPGYIVRQPCSFPLHHICIGL